MRLEPAARSNMDNILAIPISYADGKVVTLRQVTRAETGASLATIQRTGRQRYLKMTANLSAGTTGEANSAILAGIRSKIKFPPGYSYSTGQMAQQQSDSFSQLAQAIALSIVLMYMLMVALYQNFLHPLAIMFALPVSIVGAFGGLALAHMTLSIYSFLGLILLVGVVTKNAILIVDFTNQRRARGEGRKQALIEAGRRRLRPILMTTAAIVCAMLPVLLGKMAGSESRAPIAAVVIGGNVTSTLLSLVLIPVVYNGLDGFGGGVVRFARWLSAGGAEEQSALPAPVAAAGSNPGGAAGAAGTAGAAGGAHA